MNQLRRYLWVIPIIILILIGFSLLRTNLNYREQLTLLKQTNHKLAVDNKSINELLQNTTAQVNKEDLQNHVKVIINDLIKHPELIPYEGVLGGTMGFYQESSIKVLNDRWVFAEFEDGHIGGSMLLEYKAANGKITWKVIKSFLW